MQPRDYLKRAMLLDSNYINVNRRLRNNTELQRLVHGAMGLSGEAGEVTDMIKKHMIYDQHLDKEKLKKELGDVLWYMAVIIDTIGSSFEEVMDLNIEKLETRYPNGFSEQAAVARKDVK